MSPAAWTARPRRPAAFVVLAGALLCGPPGLAQQAGGASDQPVGPPMQLVPRPAGPEAAESPARPGGGVAPVEAQPLTFAEPAEDTAAAVDPTLETHGADPAVFWAGLDASEVGQLIGQIPVGAGSPAMRDLARRLLWAPLPMPAETPETLADRAGRLADLGLLGTLEGLAERHGGFADQPAAARRLAEARLMAGERDRACAVADRVASPPTGAWRPLALHCALEAGRIDAAEDLIDSLSRATDRPRRDPMPAALVALARGRLDSAPVDLPDDAWRLMGEPDPVLIAMMQAAGLPQGRAILAAPAPAVLSLVARGEANDPALRAEAAERAAEAGVLPPARLAGLWAVLPFDEPPAAALSRSGLEQGPQIRARLMRAAARLEAEGEAAEAVRYRLRALALAQAESAPLPVVLGIVSTLDPSAAQIDPRAATEAARAYYAAGDPLRGDAWRTAALAAGDDATAAALDRLWPLERLARGTWRVEDDARLADWFAAEIDGAGEVGAHAAATVLALLQAIGDPVDAGLWRRLPVDDARDSAVLPAPQLAGRLAVEARPSQPAATGLLALIALGDRGPGRAHPLLMGAVVQALSKAGLDAESRQFAREAIWTAQL